MFTALDILQQPPTSALVTALVVPKLTDQWWTPVGLQCGISADILRTICKEFPANTQTCCTRMFESWLQNTPGTGDMPRTWATVLEAVRIYYGEVVSDHITAELQSPAVEKFGVQLVNMHMSLRVIERLMHVHGWACPICSCGQWHDAWLVVYLYCTECVTFLCTCKP